MTMKDLQLDTVIHSPNRLQICSLLAPVETAEFKVLREELGVSESVLCKHIKHLEKAEYVEQKKIKSAGRQRTWVSLTHKGREAFKVHIRELKRLVEFSDTN